MWTYEKKLQYPVKIANPNPKSAQIIISQYGGPEPVPALCSAILLRLRKPVVDRYHFARSDGNAADHPTKHPAIRLLKVKQAVYSRALRHFPGIFP